MHSAAWRFSMGDKSIADLVLALEAFTVSELAYEAGIDCDSLSIKREVQRG